MAVDMFLKIDAIPGESTDDKHKDEIEVLSFSFGATQTGAHHVGGGGGAGRADISDISFAMRVNKASPKLFLAAATGQHIKEATFSFLKSAGTGKAEYMHIKLQDVIVSSYKEMTDITDLVRPELPLTTVDQTTTSFTPPTLTGLVGTVGLKGADDIPLEEVSLNFAKIEIQYKFIKADGSLDAPIIVGFDLTGHKKT